MEQLATWLFVCFAIGDAHGQEELLEAEEVVAVGVEDPQDVFDEVLCVGWEKVEGCFKCVPSVL